MTTPLINKRFMCIKYLEDRNTDSIASQYKAYRGYSVTMPTTKSILSRSRSGARLESNSSTLEYHEVC